MEKATVELNRPRSARAFLAKAADGCKKTLLTIRAAKGGKTVRDMQSLLYHLVER